LLRNNGGDENVLGKKGKGIFCVSLEETKANQKGLGGERKKKDRYPRSSKKGVTAALCFQKNEKVRADALIKKKGGERERVEPASEVRNDNEYKNIGRKRQETARG